MRISSINNSYKPISNRRSLSYERKNVASENPIKYSTPSFKAFPLNYRKLNKNWLLTLPKEHKKLGEKIYSYEFGYELSEQIYRKLCSTGVDYSDAILKLRNKIVDTSFAISSRKFIITNDKVLNANNYIDEHFTMITNMIKLLGEDTALFGLDLKAHRFELLLNDLYLYRLQFPPNIIEYLLKMTNPAQSSKYKNLTEERTEIEKKMRCQENMEFFEFHEMNKPYINQLKEQIKQNKHDKNISKIKPLYEEISEIRRREFSKKPMQLRRLEEDLTYTKAEINKLLANSIKDPQEKIDLFYLHKACTTIGERESLNKLVSDKSDEGKQNFNTFLLKRLEKLYSLTEDESNIITKLKLQESPYFTKLFQTSATSQDTILVPSPYFNDNFKLLLKTLSEEASMQEAFAMLPQNETTKRLFKEQNINFEVWSNYAPDRDILRIDDKSFVKKVDMNNIKYSLFLGNQACCCTAVGRGSRSSSAPTYIMNKFVQAIELVVDGSSVGNTMCYLANVNDKHYHPSNGLPGISVHLNEQLSLVLDNMEVLKPYNENPKYLEGFISYAKKLAKDIGAEGIPIYAGHRNSFDMREFPKVHLNNLYILGASGYQSLSLDSLENLFVVGDNISPYKRHYGDYNDIS